MRFVVRHDGVVEIESRVSDYLIITRWICEGGVRRNLGTSLRPFYRVQLQSTRPYPLSVPPWDIVIDCHGAAP